ncbi:MAG TPA: universal stress protein [Chitinophagales bacterium]|nr:universal stress protein [Chitinophagales bacterium]
MKVLICVDYGTSAEIVLAEAAKFLKNFSQPEVYVYTVNDISPIAFSEGYDSAVVMQTVEEKMNELKQRAAEIFAPATIKFDIDLGYPMVKILEKVKSLSVDLLVLGTHGRTGVEHLIIGSVAEKVLRNATCNTLVIPVKDKV